MAELCAQHKSGTLLTIQRELGDNGISERFRSLSKPDSCAEQKIWTVVEEDLGTSVPKGEQGDTGFLAYIRMASAAAQR